MYACRHLHGPIVLCTPCTGEMQNYLDSLPVRPLLPTVNRSLETVTSFFRFFSPAARAVLVLTPLPDPSCTLPETLCTALLPVFIAYNIPILVVILLYWSTCLVSIHISQTQPQHFHLDWHNIEFSNFFAKREAPVVHVRNSPRVQNTSSLFTQEIQKPALFLEV